MNRINKNKELKIGFQPWERWNGREIFFKDKNSPAKYPGVYLLAHFRRIPKNVNPLSKRICYIGETCGTLRGRLNTFHRSAFEGKDGHGGGKTYREKFNVKKRKGKDLYFSLYPVKGFKKQELRDAYIRYLERRLIWNYVLRWHDMPRCNKN